MSTTSPQIQQTTRYKQYKMIEDTPQPSGIFLQGANKKAKRPRIAKEGILGRIGGGKKAVSRTQIQVLDLISEGEIEGLVSGRFFYSGQTGDYGYVSGRFDSYDSFAARATDTDSDVDVESTDDIRWLRSIYWNSVPLVDTSEQLNFGYIDVAFVRGTPNGLSDNSTSPTETNTSFNRDVTRRATKTRNINERLRGPNYIFNSSGNPTEDFEDIYNPNPSPDLSAADRTKVQQKHRRAVVNSRKYRIVNKNCTAIQLNIRISSLQYRELRKKKRLGSVYDTTVEYFTIVKPVFTPDSSLPEAVVDGFTKSKTRVCKGKIDKGFIDSSEIKLDNMSFRDDFLGWDVTIIRKTFDSVDTRYANTTFVDSITEIFESNYSYPNSAIVSSKFSAEFFSQIPNRTFDMRLMKVKVPSNYNPYLRNYGQISGGARYHGETGLSINTQEGTMTPLHEFHREKNGNIEEGEPITLAQSAEYPFILTDGSAGNDGQDSDNDYFSPPSQVVRNISGLSQQELGDQTVNGTTDIWDGNFKTDPDGNFIKQWTDNPAWVLYDLMTNKRYGLGDYIDEEDIDKWTLFKIGQYCDQLVPDGQGGLEPRFSANILLNEREEAFKVVNNMSSIFRAIAYYGQGSIFAVQDSPKEPVMVFNNTNIKNGNFTYQSSNKKARHNVAVVKYLDGENFYQPAVEYVKDVEGIKQYGEREVETTAYGATSKSQALRWGRWTLLTEKMQTETVAFTAGLDAAYLRPGDVFRIQDSNRIKYNLAGRVSGIRIDKPSLGAVITLDRYTDFRGGVPEESSHKYGTGTLSLMLPTYNYDPITTNLEGSSNHDDIRRSQVLEFNFWTGHSLRNDADGYISNLVAPSGNYPNGLTEITLTGSVYQSHVIDANNYSLGLGSTEQPNQNISSDPFLYTIHDAQNTGETNSLYSVLSIRENEMQYEVLGLEYATGKYHRVEEDFGIDGSSSSLFSKNRPKAPAVNKFYFDGDAVPEAISMDISIAKKEVDGQSVVDPDHNTSLVFAYMHQRELLESDTSNQADPLGSTKNFFEYDDSFVNTSPSDPNGQWKPYGIATASAQTTAGLIEEIDVSKGPGVYSFAFFSMNYFGDFSSPVFRLMQVKPEQLSGEKRIRDVEIAGLSTNDAEALNLKYGDNENVTITDFSSFAFSWSVNTFGEESFLNTYGFIKGRVSRWTFNKPLDIAKKLNFVITIRDESTTFTAGVATPSSSIYNFKTFTNEVKNDFSLLSEDCVDAEKYLPKVFTIRPSDRHTPTVLNSTSSSITMEDLFKFTQQVVVDSKTINKQLNYNYEYGPPRKYEVVVEMINSEVQSEDPAAASPQGLVTSSSVKGLGLFSTTDLSSDADGENTGYDTMTIYNRRLPVFFLRKQSDNSIIQWKATLESQVYADGNDYSSIDLNSAASYVLHTTGSGSAVQSKIYKLIRTYSGTKAPRTSAGEGYWMEVDAICEAVIQQNGSIINLIPQSLVFITSGTNNVVTVIGLSDFGHQRFNDALFGGFFAVSSNRSTIASDDLYGLGNGLSDENQSIPEETEETDEEGNQIVLNKEIALQSKPFEEEDDTDEGDTDLEIDEDPQGEDFSVVEKQDVRLELSIPNGHTHLTIAFYDRFDKSVIDTYGTTTKEASIYRSKGMIYSNVIAISSPVQENEGSIQE